MSNIQPIDTTQNNFLPQNLPPGTASFYNTTGFAESETLKAGSYIHHLASSYKEQNEKLKDAMNGNS